LLWLQFISACLIIVVAGRKLVYHADRFAKAKGWGDVWIGFILLSLATTLPELFTSVGSVVLVKAPDLAIGNILGSIAFNLFIIAILDMVQGKGPILRKTDTGLILCGSISIILSTLIVAGISTRIPFTIAGLGPLSIIIVLVYLLGARLIFQSQKKTVSSSRASSSTEAFLKYLLCAFFIFGASIWLVHTAEGIAIRTGWGKTFIGALFLGIATSLPEVTTTISAARRGLFDMAIGNIFGANMLNVLIVPICDIFTPETNFLSAVSMSNILPAALGILMTATVIVGIIYRSQKSFLRLGLDVIGIALIYVVGSYLLFHMG
jgi:cation:H+ antiporter